MNLARPFQLVTPTLDGDVLSVLAAADHSFTGRQIVTLARSGSQEGIRKVLGRLVDQGIVFQQPVGKAIQYRLNRDHLAAPYIEALASLRLEVWKRFRSCIADWQLEPFLAAVFGSAARGEADASSDIDVLVVRPKTVDPDDPVWTEQLSGFEAQATAWTGNDTRVLEYGEDELPGIASVEPVLRAVVEEGIELYGSLRELRKLTRAKPKQ